MSCRSRFSIALGVLALVATGGPAWAQFGGGGAGGGGGMGGMRPGGGMGPGATPGGGAEKEEEQAAEAAPEEKGEQPALQAMPAYPGQTEKTVQFFQLHGYMRGRAYLFHNFSLGIPLGSSGPGPGNPNFVPYSEFGATGQSGNPGNAASCAARTGQNCTTDNMTSADMRMRLEPVINVSDQVRVKAQIDIFDNVVAGSTPEGYYINGLAPPRDVPLAAFTRTAVPNEPNINSFTSSIRVKRAWAEVKTPIGELSFGRKPSEWGTGMFVNSGDCLDCDYGTTVDRVMFATKMWNHFLAFMWDWVATGPTTALFTPSTSQSGQSYNADPLVNVSQWGLALGRREKPDEIKARLDNHETVWNYGAYVVYRRQDWDLTTNPGQNQPTGALHGISPSQLSTSLTPRGAWAVIPDLWFRVNTGKFHLELEGTIVTGKVNTVSDQISNAQSALTILQWGGVAKADYKLLRDALTIAFEVGYASGDQAEDPNAVLNFRQAQLVRPATQTRITNFQFDPDYHVDMILFRRIIGTVTNATYFKPTAYYDLSLNKLLCPSGAGGCGLTLRVDGIYSIANVPVSYPGNSINLGIELDGSVMYHNDSEGFYAGIMYGVLFPLAGLNIPEGIYGAMFGHDASAAQTLQARVVVKF